MNTLPYTKHVESCETKSEGGRVLLSCMLIIRNDAAAEVHRECVDIDHETFPTEAEVRAELSRIGNERITTLTNADAVAASLQGAAL